MGGHISPFLNADPLFTAAQVDSVANRGSSRGREGGHHRVERRINAVAADGRQAAPAARKRLVLAFNDFLRLARELKDVQSSVRAVDNVDIPAIV
jgi:hypothetical protein